ncbi:MAG: S-layer homology domain-containing protein, partial [Oscillospiraceae bacterium]|nr:S-layer homology domain-containing protein [Oscillospiraceae bacterium]
GIAITATAAPAYPDISGHWGETAIEKWSAYDVLHGNDLGTFDPDGELDVTQLAQILVNTFGYTESYTGSLSGYTSTWGEEAVRKAVAAGAIEASEAALPLTRELAAKIVAKAFGISPVSGASKFSDDYAISSEYKPYAAALGRAGIFNGNDYGELMPSDAFSRAQIMQALDNAVTDIVKESKAAESAKSVILNKGGVTLTEGVIEGDLIIAQGVGDGDITLDGVTVNGRLVIFGGGVNSIHVKGKSNILNVTIAKTFGQAARFVVESADAVVGTVTISAESKATVATTNNAAISKVTIAPKTQVSATGEFTDVTTAAAATVTISAKVEALAVGTKATITVTSGATVTAATIEASDVKLSGAGKVTAVTVTEDAKTGVEVKTSGTKVTVDSGAGSVTTSTGKVDPGKSSTTSGSSSSSSGGGGGGYSGGSAPDIDAAQAALTFDSIKGGNKYEEAIISDLSLPASIAGVSVAWMSETEPELYPLSFNAKRTGAVLPLALPALSVLADAAPGISAAGAVTRPDTGKADAPVKLTATLSYGGRTAKKMFELLLRNKGIADYEKEVGDARFAPGYPQVRVLEGGHIEVKAKLASEPAQPVECFIVIDGVNGFQSLFSVQSVLNGHAYVEWEWGGSTPLAHTNGGAYLLLDDGGEHVFTTTGDPVVKSSQDVQVALVLKAANGGTSENPSVIKITAAKDGGGMQGDSTPPEPISAFVNNDKNKIYIRFDEAMNIASAPPTSAFSLSGSGTVSAISIIPPTDEVFNESMVELTLSAAISDITGLTVSYTPPGDSPLKDASGNPVAAFSEFAVVPAAVTKLSAAINPAAGHAKIALTPGIGNNFFEKAWGDLYETFTVTYDGEGLIAALVMENGNTTGLRDGGSEHYLSFEPIVSFDQSKSLTWTFDESGTSDGSGTAPSGSWTWKTWANDAAAGLNTQAFDIVITGAPYTAVSAEFSPEMESVELTFTDSQLDKNYPTGCFWTLNIDGTNYTVRYKFGWAAVNGIVEDGKIDIPLESWLADKVAAADAVTISYKDLFDNVFNALTDKAGAAVPEFTVAVDVGNSAG